MELSLTVQSPVILYERGMLFTTQINGNLEYFIASNDGHKLDRYLHSCNYYLMFSENILQDIMLMI